MLSSRRNVSLCREDRARTSSAEPNLRFPVDCTYHLRRLRDKLTIVLAVHLLKYTYIHSRNTSKNTEQRVVCVNLKHMFNTIRTNILPVTHNVVSLTVLPFVCLYFARMIVFTISFPTNTECTFTWGYTSSAIYERLKALCH